MKVSAVPSLRVRGQRLAGLAGLTLFIAYFGLHCFRYPWNYDIRRHSAVVASLYRNLSAPSHEAVAAPGNLTEVHTPYLLAVAAVGRVLRVKPYRALQLAGVGNLVLYTLGILFFFSTFLPRRQKWTASITFLIATMFLPTRTYHWASETTFASLRVIAAYPSFWGWGVALIVFGAAERYRRSGLARWGAAVLVGVWALLLSHPLTGAWVTIVLPAIPLAAAARKRAVRRSPGSTGPWGGLAVRRGAMLAGLVGIAAAATLVWPYFRVLDLARFVGERESAPFGNHPIGDFRTLYVFAVIGCLFFGVLRRYPFFALGFGLTAAAFAVCRMLRIEYGYRLSFFMAFFASAAVASTVARLPIVLFRSTSRGRAWLGKAAGALYLGAFAVAAIASPLSRQEARAGRPLLSFSQLMALPPTYNDYYSRWGPVTGKLTSEDVVIMPLGWETWDIASITGASVVASPFAYRLPDFDARRRDILVFFTPETPRDERDRILRRYHVSKVLITNSLMSGGKAIAESFGPPLATSPLGSLYDPASRPPPSPK